MPRTKKQLQRADTRAATSNGPANEVLTLAEAAAYLRLPEAEVLRLVKLQDLPGRPAGTEWRFLKSAIREWLSKPPLKSNKETWMALAGVWKDDPYFDEMLKEIRKQRGRQVAEDEP